MLMYRNVMGAAFDLNPDASMKAVLDIVENFQMPGNEVEGFTRRSVAIALAGIYDLRIHHDEVLSPVLRAWNVFDRTDFGPEGEKARDASPSSWPVSTPRPRSSRRSAPRRPPASPLAASPSAPSRASSRPSGSRSRSLTWPADLCHQDQHLARGGPNL